MTLRNLKTNQLYDEKGKPLSSKKSAYFILGSTLLAQMGTAADQTAYTFHESTNRELCTGSNYYQFCDPFYVTNSSGATVLNGALKYRDQKAYGESENFKCLSNTGLSEIKSAITLSLSTLGENAINPVSTDFCTTKVDDTSDDSLVAETIIQGFSTEGCNQFETNWDKELDDCSSGCCDCCKLEVQTSFMIGGAASLLAAGLFAVKKYFQPQIEVSDNTKPDAGPAPQAEKNGCLSRLFSCGISKPEKNLRVEMEPPVVKIGEQEPGAPIYIIA
ncbi:MAG: hypothetical protein SFW66_07435 [Gammaproteobacteria bacterium]|nr:hypothetical protein [Gammaproteobacteria bacterium]